MHSTPLPNPSMRRRSSADTPHGRMMATMLAGIAQFECAFQYCRSPIPPPRPEIWSIGLMIHHCDGGQW